jgi:hypothetical protein
MRRAMMVTLALSALSVVAMPACNGVLGIGEAQLDTTIGDSGSGATCATYCTKIASVCTGANQQYVDDNVCNLFCATWDVGKATDTTTNTLSCRMNQLLSEANLMVCNRAGPTGGEACGHVCPNFCQLDFALCDTPATLAVTPAPYADPAGCTAKCGNYAHDTTNQGVASIETGNTIECRYYHLEASQQNLPTSAGTHCPHTGEVSATCFDAPPMDAGGD